jgi:hypothetical protein
MIIDTFLQSAGDYMKAADLPKPILVTIAGVSTTKMDDQERLVLHFANDERVLLCNKTNLQLLSHFMGSTETDNWTGKQIVLYSDPTIMYAGKMVAGIRVRLPQAAAPAAPAPVAQPAAPAPAADFDDDIPF